MGVEINVRINGFPKLFPDKSSVSFPCCFGTIYGIGLPEILLGLLFSAVIGNLLFAKTTNIFSFKWLFILLFSAITPVLLKKIWLFNQVGSYGSDQIKFNFIIWLLIPLTAFTFLFAKFPLLIAKFRNRNSLL